MIQDWRKWDAMDWLLAAVIAAGIISILGEAIKAVLK